MVSHGLFALLSSLPLSVVVFHACLLSFHGANGEIQIGPTNPGGGSFSDGSGNNNGAIASGFNAVAIGRDARAANPNAVAMGQRTEANGNNAVAIGSNAIAAGGTDIAIGLEARASGSSGVALGQSSTSTGTGIAVGLDSISLANGVAVGRTSNAGVNAVSLGPRTNAAPLAVAIGLRAEANGGNSVALGFGSSAPQPDSIILGGNGRDLGDGNNAPNHNVGIGTSTPNTDAALELAGDRALLLNRVTDPAFGAAGMILYESADGQVQFHDGNDWEPVGRQSISYNADDATLTLSDANNDDAFSTVDLSSLTKTMLQAAAVDIGTCKKEEDPKYSYYPDPTYYYPDPHYYYPAPEQPVYQPPTNVQSSGKGKKGDGYHRRTQTGYGYYGGNEEHHMYGTTHAPTPCPASIQYGVGATGGVVAIHDGDIVGFAAALNSKIDKGTITITLIVNGKAVDGTSLVLKAGEKSGKLKDLSIAVMSGDVMSSSPSPPLILRPRMPPV